jgi:hypothetical protein
LRFSCSCLRHLHSNKNDYTLSLRISTSRLHKAHSALLAHLYLIASYLERTSYRELSPKMSFITVAAATLPSVPLDFGGNRDRILQSIKLAKEKGASLRTGPELEIPGYGCLDHHLEGDTFLHSWVLLPHLSTFPFCLLQLLKPLRFFCEHVLTKRQEVLADIISHPICKDMLIDLGMGVRHRNVR